MAKYVYAVKAGGKYYPAGAEVPESAGKEGKALGKMKLPELKSLAEEKGIPLDGAEKKDQIIALIQAAIEEGGADDESQDA